MTARPQLGRLTSDAVPAGATLLVPLGSCEQHGPHLPLATDTIIAETVAARAAERIDGAVVGPAVTVTASGEHQGFPGTLSIGTEAMERVLVEIVRSAGWADRVVFVNGHGGNAEAVGRAVRGCRSEGRDVDAWWPDLRAHTSAGDLHAGFAETSILLALEPGLVRLDRAVAGPSPSIGELVEHGVLALSPSGVLGDPAGANAEAGEAMLADLTDQLVERCRR